MGISEDEDVDATGVTTGACMALGAAEMVGVGVGLVFGAGIGGGDDVQAEGCTERWTTRGKSGFWRDKLGARLG